MNLNPEKQLMDLSRDFIKSNSSANFTKEKYEDLLDVLRFHERKYYIENNPLFSDREYDKLFQLAKEVEKQHAEWITPLSPTQRVGSDVENTFQTVSHLTPMLSLANSYNENDLFEFDTQMKKLLDRKDNVTYAVEPKYDGGSIVLVYENDILISAATRGDGQVGEDITPNIKSLKTIPLSAPFSNLGITKVELRGEAIIPKNIFQDINKEREKTGLPVFANPRNAATGGLRMKQPQETAKRGIEAFIYQISYIEGKDYNTEKLNSHYHRIQLLSEMGFKVPENEKALCNTIQEVVVFCENWEAKRDEYIYEIDGMVVKIDNVEWQNQLGATNHHPRWAMAYKFKAKQATSKLENVEYQVGKIGTVTPVAKITPTQLAGVTISSISLHNEDFITAKDIRLYDTILIERAGDVIPYIVKSFPELRNGEEVKIEFPTSCPACGTPLIREENEAAWRCLNANCTAQVLQKMIFHVSKDAMDIEGLGKSNIINFFELKFLHDISDIYNLDYSAIEKLEGFGEKSASNIKSSIEKAKKNPLHRILHSLSIHHLGKKASKIIASHITSIYDLQDWDLEKYQEIKDIGPVLAKNITEFFSLDENIQLLKRMEKYGVDMSQKEADKPIEVREDAEFKDKTILFTGSLENFTRKEAQVMAEEQGAKVISAVSGNLNILVVGKNAGSKLAKAEKLGTVEIMTEEEFVNKIGL
ncbi:NAD-dependent DNA ligase LigA [Membranihabitans maritimus]|uniref:NAD-dependent DNA ligase LigA n=1 Tax=Membranihabitans maritimus TaxID=2904244 RepID=UPI001F025629|nr:NAD-dependent DNA ligase LigA [Membranihabitans maritimus]